MNPSSIRSSFLSLVLPEERLRTLSTVFVLLLLLAGPGCASAPPQEAEDKYKEGLARAQTDTQGAMKIFEEGLGTYPNHHRMRFALARLQHDTGETQHLESLRLRHVARTAEEAGKPNDAQKASREAQDARNRALPFYRAAKENLLIVAKNDPDSVRQAWAYYILAKCDVFFEDYELAVEHLEKAIDLGHPAGQQLGQWQEMLASLKKEAGKRAMRPK